MVDEMGAGAVKFCKMQGIGNDYIYVNCLEEHVEEPGKLAVKMSDRHFGVGSDGLVLICPCDEADFKMRMFNSDGSESEMCGNACRCIGKYVYERGLTDKTTVTLMTGAGLKVLELKVKDGHVQSVKVDMGAPELEPRLIPVDLPGDVVMGHRLVMGAGRSFDIHCVSMGNPHCVIYVKDPEDIDLPHWGAMIENHELFPRRTNVEFVSVQDRGHMTQRTWERGAGETLACGTGASAVMVASVLTGQTDREADITLKGGTLHVSWNPADNHVYQEGPAEFVFDGVWPD